MKLIELDGPAVLRMVEEIRWQLWNFGYQSTISNCWFALVVEGCGSRGSAVVTVRRSAKGVGSPD